MGQTYICDHITVHFLRVRYLFRKKVADNIGTSFVLNNVFGIWWCLLAFNP